MRDRVTVAAEGSSKRRTFKAFIISKSPCTNTNKSIGIKTNKSVGINADESVGINTDESVGINTNKSPRININKSTGTNYSFVEDLATGKVWIKVDISSKDEVFVVIFGSFAEGNQVSGRGDLVWGIRLSRAAGVFSCGYGIDIVQEQISTVGRRGGIAGQVGHIIAKA